MKFFDFELWSSAIELYPLLVSPVPLTIQSLSFAFKDLKDCLLIELIWFKKSRDSSSIQELISMIDFVVSCIFIRGVVFLAEVFLDILSAF